MFLSIHSNINTLKSCVENLSEENIKSSSLNNNLFPNFHNCFEILTKKVYQDSPLLIVPLSTPLTRTRSTDVESDMFLEKVVLKYTEYINALVSNLQDRFLSQNTTYTICKTLGGLFDFSFLIEPLVENNLSVTDIDTFTFENFKDLVNPLHFAPKFDHELKQLYFEYKVLFKFVCSLAKCERGNMNTQSFNFNTLYLKRFVLEMKTNCQTIYKFLSFVVCFPISEAIVESWGSTIDYLNKCKRNVYETSEILDTGTVDKLAFIKLNGPPPGFKANKKLLKNALTLMFDGSYANHFSHSNNVGATSKVGCNDKLLPCFY